MTAAWAPGSYNNEVMDEKEVEYDVESGIWIERMESRSIVDGPAGAEARIQEGENRALSLGLNKMVRKGFNEVESSFGNVLRRRGGSGITTDGNGWSRNGRFPDWKTSGDSWDRGGSE